ncbi:probable NADH dehydrogenase [ubiquinone] 1 alpha subcomplex subunit 5 [Trichogramma pretiosum]|uniref:probable NADH dehydrogenase [ubiquinone] 1 alpha subcomplex subunit 5 n=1 Tax=Trichogramma pretiosum TaxID=7493 RepID=UPI0006C976C8|nr:probable NADH dehydrogenase [ubiquinone] 1 alpha subcomplex subunit 5 [Trichogramma pretiosum]
MSTIIKKTTGLTGLEPNSNARRSLSITYGKIIRLLEKLPENYLYKQYTKNLIQSRSEIINKTQSTTEIEDKIGCGQIEELLIQADNELKLLRDTMQWQSWKSPTNLNIENQWSWPPCK